MVKSKFASLPLFSSKNIVMLLIDPEDGRIIDANKGAIEFYGYLYEELTALYIQDINSLPQEEIENEMKRAEEESRSYFIFNHRKADGSISSVEVHSEPILHNGKKYLFSVVQDITENKKLKKDYVDVLKRFETIFNAAGDMIFLIKTDDQFHPKKIIEVNKKAIEVLKYREDDILKQSLHDFVNAKTIENFTHIGSELLQTGESSFYTDVLDKYGDSIPLYITVNAIKYENEQAIVAIARDMSVEFDLQMDRDIQENYYRSLFTKNPSSIFLIDRDNIVCDYNASVREQLKIDLKSVIGKSIITTLSELKFSYVILEDIIEKDGKLRVIKMSLLENLQMIFQDIWKSFFYHLSYLIIHKEVILFLMT